VFKDVPSAERGIEALKRQGFPAEALSIVVRDDPHASSLVQKVFGKMGDKIEVKGLGQTIAMGSLVSALDEPQGDLSKSGLASAFKRVGFQSHDGRIFETLTERGGVLVAVRSEPRAADALSTLHCYGGGNAAIGAWSGRV
jgi:hypothetical protein